jgi:hypothetical protein
MDLLGWNDVPGLAQGLKRLRKKGCSRPRIRRNIPQGLKPSVDCIGFIGTTEVVPFQTLAMDRVFPQPVKSSIDLIGFIG